MGSVPQPLDTQDVGLFIEKIGGLLRDADAEEAKIEKHIARLRKKLGKTLRGKRREALRHARGLHTFAKLHRKELTDEERKKTVATVAGVLQWYVRQDPIRFVNKHEKIGQVIERLKKTKNGQRFVRMVFELDKEALHRHPRIAAKLGIIASSSERFAIKPKGTQKRIVKRARSNAFDIKTSD